MPFRGPPELEDRVLAFDVSTLTQGIQPQRLGVLYTEFSEDPYPVDLR